MTQQRINIGKISTEYLGDWNSESSYKVFDTVKDIDGKNVVLEYLESNKKIDRAFIQNNFNDFDIINKINFY